jgi:hypothetical protein
MKDNDIGDVSTRVSFAHPLTDRDIVGRFGGCKSSTPMIIRWATRRSATWPSRRPGFASAAISRLIERGRQGYGRG